MKTTAIVHSTLAAALVLAAAKPAPAITPPPGVFQPAYQNLGPDGAAYSAVMGPSRDFYIVSRERWGDDFAIKRIDASGNLSYEGYGGYGTSITASHSGDLYVINSSYEIWKRTGTTWSNIPTNLCNGGTFWPNTELGKNSLAYGSNWPSGGTLWAIAWNGQVYGLGWQSGYCWTPIAAPTGKIASSITINYDKPRAVGGPTIYNTPVIATTDNYMYEYTGASWVAFHNGAGRATGVAEWNNRVEVIGTGSPQYFYYYLGSSWFQDCSWDSNYSSHGISQIVNVANTEPGIYGAFVSNSGQLMTLISVSMQG